MSFEFSILITCAIIIGVLAIANGLVAYMILAERKIAAYMQDRVGPNRAFFGILQPIADGVKFLLKEEVIPDHVDKLFYMIAPAIALMTAFMAVSVVPFGATSVAPSLIDHRSGSLTEGKMVFPKTNLELQEVLNADRSFSKSKNIASYEENLQRYNSQIQMVIAPHVDISVVFVFAVGSLAVYGVILGGWSSNNKYSLMGSLRSSAQLISYEIPLGLSVIGVVLVSGSLNFEKIIQFQIENGWNVLFQPLAMILFVTSIFAECNRLPFDLPECEQELVAGYHTEYSSMKFALFLLGEYTHMITTSFLLVNMFFGGWHLPFITTPGDYSLVGVVLKSLVLVGKMLCFIGFYMFVRWTILRFRFDQLMNLAWKVMMPLALLSFVLVVIVQHFQPMGEQSKWFMMIASLFVLLVSGWIGLRLPKKQAKVSLPYLGHGSGYIKHIEYTSANWSKVETIPGSTYES